jgi:uncharacterized protein (DUF952 family)
VARIVYKICEAALWRQALAEGVLRGAAADLRDGYIHLSTAAQAPETAARHFAGAADLVLLAADAEALGDALRWEVSRGGDRFPHLYAELQVGAVLWAASLPLGADGCHVFPERMP